MLIVAQLGKRFSAFYGNRRFITVSTSSQIGRSPAPFESVTERHIQFLKIQFNIGIFPPCVAYIYHCSYACYMFHPSHPRFDHCNNIFAKSSNYEAGHYEILSSFCFLPLMSKYSHYPVIKLQSVFAFCMRSQISHFTQNKENYSFLYFSSYVFRENVIV
jgi:hypothetical protein